MTITQVKEFNSLDFYKQFHNDIPERAGLYYWIFWPFKVDYLLDENYELFIEKIRYFSSVNLNLFEESATGYKFTVRVTEKWFDNDILGLSRRKEEILLKYLASCKENRKDFLEYLKLISFSRPFYVGKADNLNTRLRQHFEGRTDILKHLISSNINERDVLIGYEVLENGIDEEVEGINSVFEEITQRIIKPALTKRPG
jgi:hypothetical protein